MKMILFLLCRILVSAHLLLQTLASNQSSQQTTVAQPPPASPTLPLRDAHLRTVYLNVIIPSPAPVPTSYPQPQAYPNQNPQQPQWLPKIGLGLSASLAQPQIPLTMLTIRRWYASLYVPAWYSIYGVWFFERPTAVGPAMLAHLGEERIRLSNGDRSWLFRLGTTEIDNVDIMSPADGSVRNMMIAALSTAISSC